jgi:glycerophosphoryl diester phosphodiesterase
MKWILFFLFTYNFMQGQIPPFDWQGHRGARGLLPENSIEGVLKSLEYPVTTIEIDLAVSKDGHLIVSHEPWMNPEICLDTNGDSILNRINLFDLTYADIKKYDCGSKFVPAFPDQIKISTFKPSFQDLIDAVVSFCNDAQKPLPKFNIEIKSEPNWDGVLTPTPEEFSSMVYEFIEKNNLQQNCNVQSFDVRILQVFNQRFPNIELAYLVYTEETVDAHIQKLGFIPQIYSPHFRLVHQQSIADIRNSGMKVIPWTVNSIDEMKRLIDLKVDGIITDYPNLILKL